MSTSAKAQLTRYGVPLLGVLLVWGVVAAYLFSTPRFTSEFSLLVPHNGADAKVALQEVGQASTSERSAFSLPGVSPMQNYKQILTSAAVRHRAESLLGLAPGALIQPRVDVVLQTALLDVRVFGGSAEQAQLAAQAYYEAFQSQLNKLREGEMEARSASVAARARTYEQRLYEASKRLIDHQANASIVTRDQFDQLALTQTDLKSKLLGVEQHRGRLDAEVQALASRLGVKPARSREALRLQTDPVFQGFVAEYERVASTLPKSSRTMASAHPKLMSTRFEVDAIQDAMNARSLELVGATFTNVVSLAGAAGLGSQPELLRELLELQTRAAGLRAEEAELRNGLRRLDDDLRIALLDRQSLADLEREKQLAEAIYVNAASRVDTSQMEAFSTYPLVQMLTQPDLNLSPHSPRRWLALLAGLTGTFGVLFLTVALRSREKWLPLLLKTD